jgi:hypothetical protein
LNPFGSQVKDLGIRTKLADHLAACTAWRARNLLIIQNDDCFDSHTLASKRGDCRKDRSALSAICKSVGSILDIAAGEHLATLEKDSCANPKVRVRSMGVLVGTLCCGDQFLLFLSAEYVLG